MFFAGYFRSIYTVSSPKNSRLRFVFHLKMASAYIPFDEVLERCTTVVPGEVLSDFSDESEEDISDHHESESEDNIYEENDIPSSNSGDSNTESDSNSMCFSVCLS